MKIKRFLRALLSVVATGGIVLALWPLGQNAYGIWSQHALKASWQKDATSSPDSAKKSDSKPSSKKPLVSTHTGSASAQTVASSDAPTVQQPTGQNASAVEEWPATRLIIPTLNLDVVVVQGWDDPSLREGPGHCPGSALPGEPGNCLIAGHRNVYGSWFYRLDELSPGAEVKLRTHHHTYTYNTLYTTTVS
ncbi:MAG: class E sortase, partial [Abitibacteriaceae bacterium]|nr:class E sortase [Abditibacteriaceae bacterium]